MVPRGVDGAGISIPNPKSRFCSESGTIVGPSWRNSSATFYPAQKVVPVRILDGMFGSGFRYLLPHAEIESSGKSSKMVPVQVRGGWHLVPASIPPTKSPVLGRSGGDCWRTTVPDLYPTQICVFVRKVSGLSENSCPASDLEFPRPGSRERLGPCPARTTATIVTFDPTWVTPTIGPHLPLPGPDTGGMTFPVVFGLGCPQTLNWCVWVALELWAWSPPWSRHQVVTESG